MPTSAADGLIGDRFMLMLKSEFKVGKTVAGVSWIFRYLNKCPGDYDFLLFDFDGRTAPLRAFYPPEVLRRIRVIRVGPRDIPRASKETVGFKTFCQIFEDLQDECPYGGVMVDSFTMLTISAMTYQLDLNYRTERKESAEKEKSGRLTIGNLRVPGLEENQGLASVLCQIFDVAKILPCDFILTAHTLTRLQSEPGTTNQFNFRKVRDIAAFGQKATQLIPGYFDEVYQLGIAQAGDRPPVRMCSTRGTGDDFAGTALPLPNMIDFNNKPLWRQIDWHLEQARQRGAGGEAK